MADVRPERDASTAASVLERWAVVKRAALRGHITLKEYLTVARIYALLYREARRG